MTSFNLDDAGMQALVSKAIIDSLTDEKRDELLRDAVAFLLTKETRNGYGSSVSPLTTLYRNAVENVARKIIAEKLQDDPDFEASIRSLFADVSARMFVGENREKLIENIVSAIGTGIRDAYR